ncbi:hypothetical protein [Profundibacterium mesophilum]|uniref:Uncharacterized protein n=1 Tax=Profundibacterium mesophilum KAUST100406-0324 TaxID=1037889 RepID=A0A921TC90_9RHOB|nr:hypothetical protein [Profundibacterium mesophilum]KAF0674836.1 hypothetical protein PMES_02912 [Profundibacterium mesophilum KAUST100406-0324]
MTARYEETTARVEYAAPISLDMARIAGPLEARLATRGARFDVIGTTQDDELQFISGSLIVTLRRCATDASSLRVAAASLVGAGHPRSMAAARFAACTAVVRQLLALRQADRVVWKHKGRTYVTAEQMETEIEPQRVRRAMRQLPEVTDMPRAALPAPRAKVALSGEGAEDGERAMRDLRRELGASPASPERDPARLGAWGEKVALYALNALLVAICAPVGAGMMVYSLLRGGSVTVSARAMGITGAGIGFSSLAAAPALAQITVPATQGLTAALDTLAPVGSLIASLF